MDPTHLTPALAQSREVCATDVQASFGSPDTQSVQTITLVFVMNIGRFRQLVTFVSRFPSFGMFCRLFLNIVLIPVILLFEWWKIIHIYPPSSRAVEQCHLEIFM